MSFDADEILEMAESKVAEELMPVFKSGMDAGAKAYKENETFNPDLAHLKTFEEKHAYVVGYTASIRIAHVFDIEALRELEWSWNFDCLPKKHPNQDKLDEFMAERSSDIPVDFMNHFESGFNMTCYDKKREHFFTEQQKADFLSKMNDAFCKGAEAGYDAQADKFKGAQMLYYRDAWKAL